MEYTINRRAGWGKPITVTIADTYRDSPPSVQLGQAVLAALLAGAYMQGADMRGADMQGADMQGADMRGAYMRGAYMRGCTEDTNQAERMVSLISGRMTRSDGYEFICYKMLEGVEIIRAGCRTFSIAQFRAHVASHYPDTAKAIETLRILDHLEWTLTAPRWC